MIGIQIILFSIVSGTTLFFINKLDSIRLRRFYYLLFTILASALIAIIIGLQGRIDTLNIISNYLLPVTLFSFVSCIEAIIVSIVIKRYSGISNIFLYVLLFSLVVLIFWSITMVFFVSLYPE